MLLCKISLSIVLNSASSKQDGSGTRCFITWQLFLIKAERVLKFVKKAILKKSRVFAFKNLPITRHRRNHKVDLTKLFTWSSMRSALALWGRFATAVGFMSCKLWLVCIGTTDNNSTAKRMIYKTGIENCTVHFDHILNAE